MYAYVKHSYADMPTYLLAIVAGTFLIANISQRIRYLRTRLVHADDVSHALLCPALLHCTCVTAEYLCCDVLGGRVHV